MRIGLISTYTTQTPSFSYGGEVYYWHLAKNLGEMGHEVHLFATGGSLTPPNGYIHYIQASPNGYIAYGIEEQLERDYHDLLMSMDIVHDCSLDHIPAERLRYLHGKKEIVNTINGSTYYMPRPPFNVVTGSKFWQDDAKASGLTTEMIYWGTDTEFYMPQGEREDYFLWIARFHPSKGLDLLLDIAEISGVKFKIAGSLLFADHKKYGQEYIKRIESIPNVEYVSLPMDSTHHEAKRDLYRKARAFVYPVNYKECFGMVVTEALACGCPVITSEAGAMPELVEDGVNGFICKNKNDYFTAITEKIPVYEKNKREHPGFDLWAHARKSALKFDVKNAAKAYEKLYQEVIGGKKQW
jgi:glycosyltransferase involved in cell wall biosynthesis